ncbi:MAG TPA: integrase domain-containing protein [Woeseiaceae bacterium]|nr:integrase domain-containing protein [Woeseiaceae bacterium]
MKRLNFALKQLCQRNRDGSYATQMARARILSLIANQLPELGFRHVAVTHLKPKHIEGLIDRWQEERLAPATIKNRMAVLRWWAEKINKQNVVAKSNSHYGIPERGYLNNDSKVRSVSVQRLASVKDEHVRMSLRLQAAFGLRREEAIKFTPAIADQGELVVLKPSWTKGGRARVIPVLNDAQRDVLKAAARLVGRGSLIPPQRSYREQLRIYERHTANAGLSKLHGLRHAYAQRRYLELTGWAAPLAGGPAQAALSFVDRERDEHARRILSAELGHTRPRITRLYVG